MLIKLFLIFFIIYVTQNHVNGREKGEEGRKRRRKMPINQEQSVASSSNNYRLPDLNLDPVDIEIEEDEQENSENLKNHKFIISNNNLYRDCHACSHKKLDRSNHRLTRTKVRTKCLECNEYKCSPCFQVKHGLDATPIIYLEEQVSAVTDFPTKELKHHKFTFDKKYRYCHHCYHKFATYAESRKYTKKVRTRCLDCDNSFCTQCLQEIHGLENPPTIYPWQKNDKVPDQICKFCNTNLGNNEDNIMEHIKRCPHIPRSMPGWHGCYRGDYEHKDTNPMRKHIRTHTNYRPYKCPEDGCQYSSKCNSNLIKHIANRHL